MLIQRTCLGIFNDKGVLLAFRRGSSPLQEAVLRGLSVSFTQMNTKEKFVAKGHEGAKIR